MRTEREGALNAVFLQMAKFYKAAHKTAIVLKLAMLSERGPPSWLPVAVISELLIKGHWLGAFLALERSLWDGRPIACLWLLELWKEDSLEVPGVQFWKIPCIYCSASESCSREFMGCSASRPPPSPPEAFEDCVPEGRNCLPSSSSLLFAPKDSFQEGNKVAQG